MIASLTKKLFYLAALMAGITTVVLIAQAQTPNAGITLKKDSNGLFIVTIKDPNGIAEFSLEPTNKFSYGGGLKGCPATFSINNVVFAEPDDFTPKMPARVVDCGGNLTEFDILPPVNGLTTGVITNAPAPAPKPVKAAKPTEEPVKEKTTKIEEPKTLPGTIKYPVPELGDCANETECKFYCDDAANTNECYAFAKKHNLLPPEEIAKAEKFLAIGNGPGGCDSQKSCETYCSEVSHLDECIAFAEEKGFISGEQLAEAKKFQTILKSGEKFPGGCTNRNTCEVYCGSPDNADECLAFAEKTGVLGEKELAEAKKFIGLMKSGETPGGCRSKEQCETYCESEENFEQCFAFAEKNGLVSKEEAEAFKKSGGKGPGNCRGRNQCEAYCQENQEECFNWAQENGLMKEEDLEQMRQGMQQFREQFDKMPPEVTQCLKDTVGEENLNKMLAGQPVFARDMESKMRGCFEKLAQSFGGPGGGFPGGPGGPGGFSGPGGCTTPEECQAYCTANPEDCQGFAPPGGGMPGGPGGSGGGGFSGPGGCASVEECTAYCLNDPEACKNFAPPGGGGQPGGGPPPGGFPGGGTTGGPPPGGFPGGGTTGGQIPGGEPSNGFPGGPGGCQSQEECTAYCQSHPQECGGGTQPPTPQPTPAPTPFSASCVERPSGLVSWWNGDLVSGTTVPDIGNGNNGTISGGVDLVAGKVGKAFKLDGDGYIKIGNPANLNFGTGPFSLEAWFNWNGGGGTSANNIIRKSNYGPGPGSGYWLRVGNGTLEFSVGATTQADGQSIITAPVSTGAWHHAVGVKDDSGAVKLYVDGESNGTILRQTPVTDSTSEVSFTIGAWDGYAGGLREFFNGLIDEVSVYNRALSASEVQTIFNAGSGGKCSGSSQQQYQQPSGLPAICANFTAVPNCSYVGEPGSQNYNYCKQCYPDK